MRWTGNVARGAWIAPRMSGWGSRDAVVPDGFAAYARIFHPGVRSWWSGPAGTRGSVRRVERPISWAGVAELTGRIAHPWMQWGGIALRQTGETVLSDGTSVAPPEDGRIPHRLLAALIPALAEHTDTPEHVVAAVWSGWGELRSVAHLEWSADGRTSLGTRSAADRGVFEEVTRALDEGLLLRLPGRDHLLFHGALAELADPNWTAAAGLGTPLAGDGVAAPQLLWPDDRAWCLATEIDFGFTLLAGDTTLVDQVLQVEGVEAMRLDVDGDLGWSGDTLNPPAPDR